MSELTRTRHAVRLEATNHEGSLLGKNVSPAKFEAGKVAGFAFADILFAIDLDNEIVLGDAFPEWRGNLHDIHMVPDRAPSWSGDRASTRSSGTTGSRTAAPFLSAPATWCVVSWAASPISGTTPRRPSRSRRRSSRSPSRRPERAVTAT
nr:hypothetical protein [Pseudonocardia sp. AL041005-10]